MKKQQLLLATIILFALSSCRFYKSTSLNAPVLQEKGEINLGISSISSTDLNASYAITDNIAVMGSYGNTYSIESETTDQNGDKIKDNLKNNKYEGGLGYYSNKDEKYFYNVFAGYAAGNSGSFLDNLLDIDSTDDEEVGLSAEFNGPFIQSGVHVLAGDQTYVGLIGRLNHFTFSDFRSSAVFDNGEKIEVGDKTALIGQVGLDLNIKGDVLGGGTQLSYTFHDNKEDYFTARKLNIHFSLYLRIEALFK